MIFKNCKTFKLKIMKIAFRKIRYYIKEQTFTFIGFMLCIFYILLYVTVVLNIILE